jgi:hypothetical protein
LTKIEIPFLRITLDRNFLVVVAWQLKILLIAVSERKAGVVTLTTPNVAGILPGSNGNVCPALKLPGLQHSLHH